MKLTFVAKHVSAVPRFYCHRLATNVSDSGTLVR